MMEKFILLQYSLCLATNFTQIEQEKVVHYEGIY